MGLTLETVAPTVATATPDKQISVRYVTGGTGTVLYTVPSGRKFKGILTSNFAQVSSFTIAQIDGLNVDWYAQTGPLHIELGAGAVVGAGSASYPTGVFGVESDA